MKTGLESSVFRIISNIFEAKDSVPGTSNKLGDWVIDWVRDFAPRASSAMEALNETKYGTKVA